MGREEGSGAQGERTAGIVVMVGVVVEMKGVCGNGGIGTMANVVKRGSVAERRDARGEGALSKRGRANE